MTTLECRQIFAVLSEYLDRDLPPNLCEQIGQHIEGCPPCVEFVRSLEKTVELCRKVEITDAKPVLSKQKLDELRAAYDAQCSE